jgi:hypothetical protein
MWISTRTQIIFTACACAGISAFLYAVDPNHHAVYPQCLLYKTTGLYCAGCGATRALHALLHGHLLEALRDNALFIAALPVGIWLAASYLTQAWRARAWPEIQIEGKSLIRSGATVFGLMLAFMALRNLPGCPFDLLKPLAAHLAGS